MPRTISETLLKNLYAKEARLLQAYTFVVGETTYNFVVNNASISGYQPCGIKRTSIKSEEGTILNELEIGLDNIDLAFREVVMSGKLDNVLCTVKLLVVNSSNGLIGSITQYSGYMDAPKGDEQFVSVSLRPFPLLEREFPRRVFQVQCNWTFGSTQCGMDIEDYRLDTTLGTDSDGVTFTVAHGQSVNYFVPGFVLIMSGDYINDARPIYTNDSGSVIVRIPFDGPIVSGTSIRIQKLCDKTAIACQDIFDNYLNFGGFPQQPKQPIL